jgi:hypothetical protein
MARQLAPGDVIGGFGLEQRFHHGDMGTLWKVSRARRYIGSVSVKVVAEAPCSVTVVRA